MACQVETSVRRINVDDVETLGVKAGSLDSLGQWDGQIPGHHGTFLRHRPSDEMVGSGASMLSWQAYDKQGNVFSSLEGLQLLGAEQKLQQSGTGHEIDSQ